ncbi:glycoside hydrolase family 31 protein [Butyrivibrio sp. LC3010]|uniref:glycoside hydrolase family 31 protein n=1 Tax=Butyrivibrio sp. LC3010 TaxID=1280680 RepID=UPI0004119C64|nr:glycoside hydrolase family 31 protein [Butyrivibrio sp. LC3010]
MNKTLNITRHPVSKPENVICQGNYRITILTERLIRFEYSKDQVFEDRATQVVLNRDFPKVSFSLNKTSERIEIKTRYLHLYYDEKEPGETGLQVEIKDSKTSHVGHWYYGKKAQMAGNLGGTIRTLDEVNGSCPIDAGLVSKDGWGLHDDSTSLVITEDGWVALREHAETDLYLFGYGSDYKGCLHDFYTLTGKTPMLPRFVLGNWWSRYYEYSEKSYRELMERFDDEGIPFSVAVIDMDWHLVDIDPKYGSGWTGFSWNKKLFPDPPKFMKYLHDRGMKVTLNLHPADGIRAYEDCYHDIAEKMGVDIQNQETVEFDAANSRFIENYLEYVCHPHEKDGVDFWWIDWQQGTKTGLKGLDPLWILNHYHYLDSGRNGLRPLTFSRYAGPGSHRYPIGFSGDTVVTWESLQFQPYFTATASNIGYGWWSHDIGGHTHGYKDDQLECRWYQFGVFSPIMRLHSEKNEFNGKEPWRFRKDISEIMKRFLRLRHELLPYLYTMNYRAYKFDEPIIQPLYYNIMPDEAFEQAYEQVKNEYYFGTEMIVSPVTSKCIKGINVAKTTTYLPEGNYYDFFTDVIYSGGKNIDCYRTLESIPLFVPEGGIIPMTDKIGTKDVTTNPDSLVIHAYAGKNGSFTMYEDDNVSMGYVDGDAVFTEFILKWSDEKSFTIKAPTGNISLLPRKRDYRIVIHGADMSKYKGGLQSYVTVSDGSTPIGAEISYNEKLNQLIVNMPECSLDKDITITIPADICLKKNAVKSVIFDFLNQAEISFALKNDIYWAVDNGDTPDQIMESLEQMNIENDLYKAIYEIIYSS